LTKNPYLFQGRRLDEESGLDYFRNRQYDPVHGRFLSRDPAGYKDSYCLYAFVNNNPVCYVDPMGLGTFHVHFDLKIDLPVIGIVQFGSWDGDFIWSCIEGKESSSISMVPGFSGLTTLGISLNIGPVGIGYSISLSAHSKNTSRWENCIILDEKGDYCEIGMQYIVNLEIIIKAKAVGTPISFTRVIQRHLLFNLCPCRPKP